jgi:RES domain-containing protein
VTFAGFTLDPGVQLVRFFHPKHGPWNQQRSYGPLPKLRFDHHLGKPGERTDRAVWYASTSLIGAVSEAFGNLRFLDKASGRHLCVARTQTRLLLIDLVGIAARTVGLDQRIGTITDYGCCQEWARAFYDQYSELQGIRWRGRQSGSICVLLNDRVDMGSLELLSDSDIAHPDVWPRIERAAYRARLRTAVLP